jgi:toxin ParE1/3/4
MSQYIIADEAIQDLNGISDYFLERNLDAGEQFLQAFTAKCRQLVSFPKIGRPYSHILPGLRGLALKGFIILYRVTEMEEDVTIEILRVVNGRRDLKKLFSED